MPDPTPQTQRETLGQTSTLPVPTCCSLLLPLVAFGVIVGDGGCLIPRVPLAYQRANVSRYCGLTSTPFHWHGQYLGRRGFFGATSITQCATGGGTRLRTNGTDPAATLAVRDQNLTGLHLLRC